MKQTVKVTVTLIILIVSLMGCASETASLPTSSMDLVHTQNYTKSTALTTPTLNSQETKLDLQAQEEKFVNLILQAINENDTSTLIKNYDSVYGEPTADEIKEISKGLELYHKYFKGEKLVRFEFGKNIERTYDTPNTTGKQYFLISQNGIKRDIIIKCFSNDKVTFKYNDPLLFYGAETVSRVKAYFKAIQTQDIGYLYNYIRLIKEDSDAVSYSDPKHNKKYEAMALKVIKNYEAVFKLDTMKCDFTGKISDICESSSLNIEFKISGLSTKGDSVEHTINGVFEFPMWGIHDQWLRTIE